MHDRLCFVQFIHPGEEHDPDSDFVKGWNKTGHKRKFLRQHGEYLFDPKDKRTEKGEIVFWGEWEAESKAEGIDNPVDHGPRYIYEPYYVVPSSYERLQNTDPFVFGKCFHYTWCLQRTKKGPTQMRYLKEGSVILFGSCEDRKAFVLDTVFVVGCRRINHSRANYRRVLQGAVSREYWEVGILPGYQEPSAGGNSCAAKTKSCRGADAEQDWRLYFGATHNNPVHGMYSFLPCQPHQAESRGFARPRIRLPCRVTDNLSQGFKYRDKNYPEELNPDTIKPLWEEVAEQVIKNNQRLALGVYADMPKRCVQVTNLGLVFEGWASFCH